MRNESLIAAPSKEQVSCEMDGDTIILELREGGYFELNEIGTSIWNVIQKRPSIQRIVAAMLDEYDVTGSQFRADLEELLDELVGNGLVEIRDAEAEPST
ncbi:MAG: PqqD family protein [Candidatus Sumerlaeota bacterium]|nr:PqqD family protein [Candidatus Sumerlaeota bacterium]